MWRLLLAVALAASCSDDGGGPAALFPVDYAATYQQVRNCRRSLDHDMMNIRVMASPEALTPYQTRTAPFPTGAIVVKEQYPSTDTACAGPIEVYTVMQKLDVGSATATLDWTWQKVDADLHEMTTDLRGCVGCHTSCGVPPDGYDGTCTVP